jgi:hypothetical protein
LDYLCCQKYWQLWCESINTYGLVGLWRNRGKQQFGHIIFINCFIIRGGNGGNPKSGGMRNGFDLDEQFTWQQ